MVRKLEQRRVRGALDRFGPPMQSGGGDVLKEADDGPSVRPRASLEVQRSYIKVRGCVDYSSTTSQARSAPMET
jgi:hypothetical protein